MRCLSSWNSTLPKASRAEFSHQYFLVAAEICLQIFRFVIGALRSVSGQTSFDDSKDYRTRRTGAPQNTGGGSRFQILGEPSTMVFSFLSKIRCSHLFSHILENPHMLVRDNLTVNAPKM